MTDNEIMQALECCTNSLDCPAVCPLYEYAGDCFLALHKPTLDLINRQKAEIDELKLICDKEKADRLYLVQANKSLIAGQETLQRALSDEIAKNEELKNQDMVVIRGSRGCGKTQFVAEKIRDSINRIRAEAIKEFAELSIKRICENVTAPTPTESYIVEKCNQEIDNLVKEMVGDTE